MKMRCAWRKRQNRCHFYGAVEMLGPFLETVNKLSFHCNNDHAKKQSLAMTKKIVMAMVEMSKKSVVVKMTLSSVDQQQHHLSKWWAPLLQFGGRSELQRKGTIVTEQCSSLSTLVSQPAYSSNEANCQLTKKRRAWQLVTKRGSKIRAKMFLKSKSNILLI